MGSSPDLPLATCGLGLPPQDVVLQGRPSPASDSGRASTSLSAGGGQRQGQERLQSLGTTGSWKGE